MPGFDAQLLDPATLSRIANYQLLARQAVDGFLSGLHRSRAQGFGTEFLHYRPYSPGEDPRYIDWKVYARRQRLQTKVYREETHMQLILLLDASASMDYAGSRAPCSKFRYAAMLAAALTHLAHRQGDQVGLLVYNDSLSAWIPPANAFNRIVSIYTTLAATHARGTANHRRAFDFIGHHLRERGLLILLSDMLEAEAQLPSLLNQVRIRQFDCAAFQILDPDELDFPSDEAARFVDLETDAECLTSPRAIAPLFNAAAQSARNALAHGMAAAQIELSSMTSNQGLGTALADFLHRRSNPNRRR